MPKKTPKKTLISFRLQPSELEPLDADRKALPGVPVARNTYAKHAVAMYPKLRKLEEAVRWYATTGMGSTTADDCLKKAGL